MAGGESRPFWLSAERSEAALGYPSHPRFAMSWESHELFSFAAAIREESGKSVNSVFVVELSRCLSLEYGGSSLQDEPGCPQPGVSMMLRFAQRE